MRRPIPQSGKCDRIVRSYLSVALFVGLTALAIPGELEAQQAVAQEPQGEIIGTIEGQAIALKGPMSVQVVGNEVKTLLRSGVDVRVKSGHARIDLSGGGTIAICGPAHISLLKAANGLTVALDSGTIHAHIEGDLALNVFTTQIVAKSIAIGDGPTDLLVGFDTPGLMCVRAGRGAVRLQEQFGSQSIVVPQGSDVTLANGQLDGLRNNNALCACDPYSVEMAVNGKGSAPESSTPQTGALATSDEIRKGFTLKNPLPAKRAAEPVEPPKADAGPTYQVYMPPLRYDASQRVQDEPDAKLIVLVRRVRVRPTLIFESRVEGDEPPVQSKSLSAAAKPQNEVTAKPAAAPTSAGIVDRVKNFLKSLWTPNS
jgi:hypothetical protein